MKRFTYLVVIILFLFGPNCFGQTSGCAIAKFVFHDTMVTDGASIQTFDLHAGKLNMDGYNDLLFYFGKSPDTVGPTILLNKTPAPRALLKFEYDPTQYVHIGGHVSSYTAFMSDNCAVLNGDSLSDIVDMWGDSIYFWKNNSTGSAVKFKMTCVLSTIPGLMPTASCGGSYNSILFGDVNGDGLTDVIADGRRGEAVVFINHSVKGSGKLAFTRDYVINYAIAGGIRQGGYGHLQTSACADLNADGKTDFVSMNGDSVVTFKNTTTGGIVSFAFDTVWVLPLNISNSGNYTLNCMIYDIDRDGAPDFMTHYRAGPGDSNFIFMVHHRANPNKIGWDSTSVFNFIHRTASGHGKITPDMGAAYLYAPFCDKPDLIALFDAAESGSSNTFYYFQNLSKPGHIKFDTGACIINDSHSDVLAYADFNRSNIQSYVTYQDGNAITVVTDTVKVKLPTGGSVHKLSGYFDTSICEGQYVSYHLLGGISYQWDPPTALDTIHHGGVVLARPHKTTHYKITAKVGCNTYDASATDAVDTAGVNIVVLPIPTLVVAGKSFTSIYGTTYNFPDAAVNGLHWQWLSNKFIVDSNNLHTNTLPLTETSVFILKTFDTSQCTIYDTMVIAIDNKALVSFPSAFSPNHDGVNDYFLPHYDNISEVHWFVYSRWGELLFETRSTTGRWDGTFKGQPLPVGTYVYFGDAVSKLTGRSFRFKGNMELVK